MHPDLSTILVISAKNSPRHLGSPGPHQPGKAENLALTHGKADVAYLTAAVEPLDLKGHRLAGGVRNGVRLSVEGASHHHGNDGFNRRFGGRNSADIFAIAHDRHAVRDALDLIHLVRDVDDADALGLEPVDDRKQFGDFGVVKGCGRLIHDENPAAVGQRLGNFDHLLFGNGQRLHQHGRLEIEIHRVEDRGGIAVELTLIKDAEAAGFATNEDVLRSRQIAHQGQFLVNDGDAGVLSLAWRGDLDRLAIKQNFARIPVIDTGQHLHQGRLTRAILAHQGVDFAGQQFELRLAEGPHAGKRLVDIAHFDQRHGSCRSIDCRSPHWQASHSHPVLCRTSDASMR